MGLKDLKNSSMDVRQTESAETFDFGFLFVTHLLMAAFTGRFFRPLLMGAFTGRHLGRQACSFIVQSVAVPARRPLLRQLFAFFSHLLF